jgi:formiminoglutamase
MLSEFLAPVSASFLQRMSNAHELSLFRQTLFHQEIEGLPDWKHFKIAIVGVCDDRGSRFERGAEDAPDAIREQLYRLYTGNWPGQLADLGNIYRGETVNDTYAALREVARHVLQRNIPLIVLGGSQDLTYACYRAYDSLEQMVNLVAIDREFDLGAHAEPLNDHNYLSHIVLNQPYNLFNFANLGYQTFFVNQEEVDLMERMYFETHRLGSIKNDLREIEPVVRDADIVSFDMGSIRGFESPGHPDAMPNGFDGMEACTIARYSGLSDKVSTFGIFNVWPNLDAKGLSSKLAAQMIWYFIEGFFSRKGDFPFSSKKDYAKFIVLIEDGDFEMIFYKSPKSNRWWIEVPGNRVAESRNKLIPCTHKDYIKACNQTIPERWWKARQRGI